MTRVANDRTQVDKYNDHLHKIKAAHRQESALDLVQPASPSRSTSSPTTNLREGICATNHNDQSIDHDELRNLTHPSVDLGAVKEGGGEVLLLALADSGGPDDAGHDEGDGNGGVRGQGMR